MATPVDEVGGVPFGNAVPPGIVLTVGAGEAVGVIGTHMTPCRAPCTCPRWSRSSTICRNRSTSLRSNSFCLATSSSITRSNARSRSFCPIGPAFTPNLGTFGTPPWSGPSWSLCSPDPCPPPCCSALPTTLRLLAPPGCSRSASSRC